MNKKWLLLPLIIISVIGIYFYFLKPPTAFLTEQQLIDEMNDYDSGFIAEKIIEKIEVDSHHYYVPFIVDTNEPGMSFWKWSKGKWQLVKFMINNDPIQWQLDKKDQSTNYIVWHVPLRTSAIKLYGIRERNLHWSSNGGHYYIPRIQLSHEIANSNTYGIEKLPQHWGVLMNDITGEQMPTIFDWMSPMQNTMTIHMDYPEDLFGLKDNSSSSFYTGNADSTFHHIMYINESRIE